MEKDASGSFAKNQERFAWVERKEPEASFSLRLIKGAGSILLRTPLSTNVPRSRRAHREAARNLPHWQQGNVWVFLTWRLADSLPEGVMRKILQQREDWELSHPKPWDDETLKEYNRLFTLRFEGLLDDCHGSCCLRDPAIRRIVTDAFHHFDGDRYSIASFVVMPNHVHVLFQIIGDHQLGDVIHSWKSFTAHGINKHLGRTGALWQREYWDRLVRSKEHFDWTMRYIAENPAKLREDEFTLWRRTPPAP